MMHFSEEDQQVRVEMESRIVRSRIREKLKLEDRTGSRVQEKGYRIVVGSTSVKLADP